MFKEQVRGRQTAVGSLPPLPAFVFCVSDTCDCVAGRGGVYRHLYPDGPHGTVLCPHLKEAQVSFFSPLLKKVELHRIHSIASSLSPVIPVPAAAGEPCKVPMGGFLCLTHIVVDAKLALVS